ncbi:nucleotidyl transferase AbiEii/AbiGii toxin family protein [Planctomycetota bacterium]
MKNIAASVHQRLLNQARQTDRPFNELLQYYAMERFLYRLGVSNHADKFVLKGALMFTVWRTSASRSTMDIDLLGNCNNATDEISTIIRDICTTSVEPDGLLFDTDSINAEYITEDADYEGVIRQVSDECQPEFLFHNAKYSIKSTVSSQIPSLESIISHLYSNGYNKIIFAPYDIVFGPISGISQIKVMHKVIV